MFQIEMFVLQANEKQTKMFFALLSQFPEFLSQPVKILCCMFPTNPVLRINCDSFDFLLRLLNRSLISDLKRNIQFQGKLNFYVKAMRLKRISNYKITAQDLMHFTVCTNEIELADFEVCRKLGEALFIITKQFQNVTHANM